MGSRALRRKRRAFRGRRHDLVREPDAGKPHVRFDERRLETESWRGVRHRHRRKPPATATPCAYRHRASRRLYRPPLHSSGDASRLNRVVRRTAFSPWLIAKYASSSRRVARRLFSAGVGGPARTRAALRGTRGSTTGCRRIAGGRPRAVEPVRLPSRCALPARRPGPFNPGNSGGIGVDCGQETASCSHVASSAVSPPFSVRRGRSPGADDYACRRGRPRDHARRKTRSGMPRP